MFDDPKKELQRLEEELLKQETDDEFEAFYHDIFEEFGPGSQEEQPAPAEAVRPAPKAKTSAYADTPRAVAPKKEKSNRGLLITIAAELVAIAAVVLWWVFRIL